MEVNFTVVIVTYNRLELLKECIDCIEKQTMKVSNIVIVNNASKDGTREYLNVIKNREEYKIVNLKKNIGGAGGFYYGIKAAMNCNGEWIVIIDDDAMLSSDFIEIIFRAISEHNSFKAFSGTVMNNNKITKGHRKIIKNKSLYKVKSVSEMEYINEYFICDLASFCGVVINKEIIAKIGLPIKEYFIWYDDTEYCCRINKYSRILNVNRAVVNHKTKETAQSISWKYYYGRRNEIHYVMKHFPKSALFACLFKQLYHSIKSVFSLVTKKKVKELQVILRIFIDGMRDGILGNLGKNNKYMP